MSNRAVHGLNRIIKTVAFLGLILVICLGTEFTLNLRAERRARSALDEIRALAVGVSTETEVQNVVDRNGGEGTATTSGHCGPDAKSHSVMVASRPLDWLGAESPALRLFGDRAWAMDAFLVTSNGMLCFKSYDVRALRSRYSVISASASTEQGFRNAVPPPYVVYVGSRRMIDFIRVETTTDATEEQRQRAFDFDLSCLLRFGGCRARCELMPHAWTDYLAGAKENGWDMPAGELANQKCH